MKKILLTTTMLCGLLFAANQTDISKNIETNSSKLLKTEKIQKAVLNPEYQKGDYNKGFKYYKKYLKKYIGPTPKFLKSIEIENVDQLNEAFANNAEKFKKAILQNKKYVKAFSKIKKMEKKHQLKDLYQFFKGVLEGKIPAGCS